jgi:aminocarboxymuconate-semialdehyde decarboxylase
MIPAAAGPIDVHTHVVPETTPFLERLARKDPRWAVVQWRTDDAALADVLVSGKVFRTIRRVACDLAERRAEQTAAGLAGQVISAMPELFAPWAPGPDAVSYCRAFNEWITAQTEDHDGYFTGLGLVPVQDPAAATAMLGEVRGLGLAGVEIPSTTEQAPLHERRFEEFWSEAERLGLLVFVHSVGAVGSFGHPMAGTSAIFPSRIGEAMAGLIANGVLARHPALRILASHGGGSLPVSLARLDFVRATTPALREPMPEPAVTYAARLWYDQLVFDPRVLGLLAGMVGADRIVLGSDYPFLTGDPAAALDDSSMPAGFAEQVRNTNPRRLLQVKPGRLIPGDTT